MKEKRHFHHFLNLSRKIHDTIIATNAKSVEIVQNVGVVLMMKNIAAAKSAGNIHQNLLMNFSIVQFDLFCFLLNARII